MKNMFKIIGITVIVLVIGFAFTSCFEDDEHEIVGKYYLTQGTADAGEGLLFEFKANGKYNVANAQIGSYSVKGKTITSTFLGAKLGTIDYVLEGTKLTLSNMTGAPMLPEGTYYRPK